MQNNNDEDEAEDEMEVGEAEDAEQDCWDDGGGWDEYLPLESAALRLEEAPNLEGFTVRPAGVVLPLESAALRLDEDDEPRGSTTVRPAGDELRNLPQSSSLAVDLRRFADALQRHRKICYLTLGPMDQFADEEADVAAAGEGENGVEAEGDRNGGIARQIQRAPDPEEVNRQAERLFGSVIPRHSTLGFVTFEGCLSRSVELFAAAFPAATRPLAGIEISNVALDSSCLLTVATMARSNVEVSFLLLRNTGLDGDGYKAVCDAIGVNRHLRTVKIFERRLKPRADTFTGLVPRGSLLKELHIRVAWTQESYVPFVRCLRTNETLSCLHFDPLRPTEQMPLGPLEDLLWSHNCTLDWVGLVPSILKPPPGMCNGSEWRDHTSRVDGLVRRNRQVKRTASILAHLERPYRIDSKLWARAIGKVSSHPYLIQRILRRGNVDQFAGHVGRLVEDDQLHLRPNHLRPQRSLSPTLHVCVPYPDPGGIAPIYPLRGSCASYSSFPPGTWHRNRNRSLEIADDSVLAPVAAPLLERCMRECAWNEDMALTLLDTYVQYLQLKKIHGSTVPPLSPPRPVDQMVHQHFLLLSDFALVVDGIVSREPRSAHEREEDREERGIATRRAFLTHQEVIRLAYEEWKDLFESPHRFASESACWIPNPSNEATITLYVRPMGGPDGYPLNSWSLRVHVPPTTGRVGDVVDLVLAKAGIPHSKGICLHEGREIDPNEDFYATPRSLGMRHLSVIVLAPRIGRRIDTDLQFETSV